MAVFKVALLLSAVFVFTEAQRPFYAGSRAIGYPEMETNEILQNRFSEDVPAPIEARGDGSLINRLNSMPVDKQPFWFINYRAYDALRNSAQTWPLRKSGFIDK